MKPFPSRKARAIHLQKDHKRVHPFPQWGTCSVCSWKGPGLAKHWKKEHPGQFGCGISKMIGLKKQDFWPRINILKGYFFLNSVDYSSSKSAKIVLSKSIFNVKNQLNFFKQNFHLRISI